MQPRPDLDRRLDAALTHRLTTVVAAAGYGKSTLLATWVRAVRGAMHLLGPGDREPTRLAGSIVAALRDTGLDLPAEVDTPLGPDADRDELVRAGALAGAVAEALAEQLKSDKRDLALVLDDVDVIADAPGALRFVELLVRAAPRRLHLVLASRDTLPFPTARLEHDMLTFDARDLALTADETKAWLDTGDDGLAARVHAATGGWPVAVRAAVDALARSDGIEAIAFGSPEQLIQEAFEALPAPTRRLLRAATVLPVLTDDLATALGADPGSLAALASRGLFLEATGDGHRLNPLTRQVLRRHAPLRRRDAFEVAAIAAQWFVRHADLSRALRVALDADHLELIEQLVRTSGQRLADRPDDLLAGIARLPGSVRDEPEMLRLAGVAHQNRGDWDQARNLLTRVADTPAFDASAAWRIGIVDYLRGDLAATLAICRRGMDHGGPPGDVAMCAATAAAAQWLGGSRDGCAELADQALDQATAADDPRALAAAHTVLAMLAAVDGDRRANDAHYLRALAHAERAGDVMQQIRIRSNRAVHFLREGAYEPALAELDRAAQLADLTSFAPLTALTQANRAETLIRMGRLEEAAAAAADSVARWSGLRSHLIGYGLNRLAQIQALRGDPGAAAQTYRQAMAAAEAAGESQGLGTALTGLAELIAADDPDEAQRLVDRALEPRFGMAAVRARLANVRVALAAGRTADAKVLLEEADAVVVARRDRAGVAAVKELRAVLEADATLADEAVAEWAAVGNPVSQARVELVRARLGEPAAARAVADDARARMLAIGCRALDADLDALVAWAAPAEQPWLVVETLGGLRVVREGVAVAQAAWGSRKARDLLKILVTRRGRPVAREHVAELLWPDADDPAAGLRRLNVMVSTLRSVLDPERRHPPGHVVVSEAGTLRLDLAHVTVDVEEFFALVASAMASERDGRPGDAVATWRAAEAAYPGDFSPEDAYADWSGPMREEARIAYAQAASRVADAEEAAGAYEQAARLWLRLLERDPYDERAHLALVRVLDRAGRRGDARRRYHAYADQMRELDVEPSPYPATSI